MFMPRLHGPPPPHITRSLPIEGRPFMMHKAPLSPHHQAEVAQPTPHRLSSCIHLALIAAAASAVLVAVSTGKRGNAYITTQPSALSPTLLHPRSDKHSPTTTTLNYQSSPPTKQISSSKWVAIVPLPVRPFYISFPISMPHLLRRCPTLVDGSILCARANIPLGNCSGSSCDCKNTDCKCSSCSK